MKMRKLFAANWKENPRTEAQALRLFKEIVATMRTAASGRSLAAVEIVICPPFIFLEKIAEEYKKMGRLMGKFAKKNLLLGAQDAFWEERGAYTGEVGPKMIFSLGARYVIIGHSERRRYLKETDEVINKKIALALQDGLRVILCVGESAEIRKKGIEAAREFVKNQLKKDLKGVGGWKLKAESLVVAYEPIWAIGSGKNDDPRDAAAMAAFIKKETAGIINKAFTGKAGAVGKKNIAAKQKIRVLYGGSVNGKNAKDYVQCKEIDGALVGGASLKAAEFHKIMQSGS
jgi:triosephosphate isomerase